MGLGAENLKAVSNTTGLGALLKGRSTANPYAVIWVQDEDDARSKKRRTERQTSSVNPMWNASFDLFVRTSGKNLTLYVDIYHEERSDGKEGYGKGSGDIWLGKAS